MLFFGWVLVFVVLLICGLFINRENIKKERELTDYYKGLYETDRLSIDNLNKQYKKLLHQKKSSEVRTGMIAEQMAPFLSKFPYDPKKAIFMGNPIDFVVFDEEGVHFVEVKSGKSQLNANQRKVRDLIKEGRVTFEVYRIKGE